jgi:hypothetical protein
MPAMRDRSRGYVVVIVFSRTVLGWQSIQANMNAHTAPAPPPGGLMGQVLSSFSKIKETASKKGTEMASPGPQVCRNVLSRDQLLSMLLIFI